MQRQRLLTAEKLVSHRYFQCETNLLARFAFLRFSRTLEIQDSSPDFGVLMLVHNLGKKQHFVLEIPAHDKISPPLKMFLSKCQQNGDDVLVRLTALAGMEKIPYSYALPVGVK